MLSIIVDIQCCFEILNDFNTIMNAIRKEY